MEQALIDLPGYQSKYNLVTNQPTKIDDGKLNDADLQALLDNLKSGGGSTNSVPEPSTFVLAVLAGLMLTTVRKIR